MSSINQEIQIITPNSTSKCAETEIAFIDKTKYLPFENQSVDYILHYLRFNKCPHCLCSFTESSLSLKKTTEWLKNNYIQSFRLYKNCDKNIKHIRYKFKLQLLIAYQMYVQRLHFETIKNKIFSLNYYLLNKKYIMLEICQSVKTEICTMEK